MRVTITFDDDVAAAVEEVRRERSIGLSEAVNELVRAGLTYQRRSAAFEQRTHDLGQGVDFSDIAGTIETLEQSGAVGRPATDLPSS